MSRDDDSPSGREYSFVRIEAGSSRKSVANVLGGNQKASGTWLEVGDERFNSIEIQRLYEADDYPLRKPE